MRSWLLGLLAAGCVSTASAPPPPGAPEDVRRVVATLDDLAGEYPLAVEGGAVIDPVRMAVLDRLLHDAEIYAHRFPAEERASLRAVVEAVGARADAADVADTARRLRGRLLADHQTVLAPGAPPSRARAEQQWVELCAGCHGSVGAGDGPQGVYLEPEPKDFHDPEFMQSMAPSRAFSRIADGVPGTAMPQWGLFSNRERWGLAFLVFSFRHEEDPDALARGRVAAERVGAGSSLAAVADRTDDEVLGELRRAGLSEPEARDALAFLRTQAVFAPTGDVVGPVRTELAAALDTYRARFDRDARGHLAAARRALAARIDGIRAVDRPLAARLEQRLAEVDATLAGGALAETVEREVVNVDVLLDRAAAGSRAPSVAGGVLLALEWAAAAALGLGLALAGPRRTARPWLAPGLGLALGGALGAGLAPGAPPAGLAALGVAAILALAAAGPARRRDDLVIAAAAALVGLALGSEARALFALSGGRALAPVLAAAGTVAAVVLAARILGGRRVAAIRHLPTAALAIAAAASAGRGAWILVATTVRPGPELHTWRIDSLGLFPAVHSIAAAALAAVVTVAASVWSRRAGRSIVGP